MGQGGNRRVLCHIIGYGCSLGPHSLCGAPGHCLLVSGSLSDKNDSDQVVGWPAAGTHRKLDPRRSSNLSATLRGPQSLVTGHPVHAAPHLMISLPRTGQRSTDWQGHMSQAAECQPQPALAAEGAPLARPSPLTSHENWRMHFLVTITNPWVLLKKNLGGPPHPSLVCPRACGRRAQCARLSHHMVLVAHSTASDEWSPFCPQQVPRASSDTRG